jgi:hypothetical protein
VQWLLNSITLYKLLPDEREYRIELTNRAEAEQTHGASGGKAQRIKRRRLVE